VRGIEVSEKSIGINVMRDVCIDGPGHYLGHSQTIALMQTEYVYPAIGDRSSPKEWEELGKPNLVAAAVKAKQDILQNFHPAHISPELDSVLRATYDIRLD
jgi:trimethylamine--corrinoid protein Co-methyltransferase